VAKNSSVQTKHIETNVLLQEYKQICNEIQELTRRRQALRKLMQAHGTDPVNIFRLPFYDKPIMLYALKLEGGYWYVGMTRNPEKRFKRHLSKKGAAMWTKEHKPLEIYEVRETGLNNDSEVSKLEDEMTIEYAKKYGIDYVRGGGYCQRKPKWPEDILEPNLKWLS
jgi:predicted GIY-YIG superfamily endonuclease